MSKRVTLLRIHEYLRGAPADLPAEARTLLERAANEIDLLDGLVQRTKPLMQAALAVGDHETRALLRAALAFSDAEVAAGAAGATRPLSLEEIIADMKANDAARPRDNFVVHILDRSKIQCGSCSELAVHTCDCARCRREHGDVEECFFACQTHLDEAASSHRRIRGREPEWRSNK
jgi:hypothetical protein